MTVQTLADGRLSVVTLGPTRTWKMRSGSDCPVNAAESVVKTGACEPGRNMP